MLKRVGTIRGTRPWLIKRTADLLASGDTSLPGWQFNPQDISFSAGLALRTRTGAIFESAPAFQGVWSEDGTAGDRVTITEGAQIAGAFYENFDATQGTILFWFTPEWDGDDGKNHGWFNDSSSIVLKKSSNDQLYIRVNDINAPSYDVSGWTAGETYFIVFRWDQKNTLDGTNYGCLSIDNIHDFADTSTAGTPSVHSNFAQIGTAWNGYQADGILEGLTIYRRPLFDGTYGYDFGNGDEISLIHAGGSGKDPTLITGSWDVTFCLCGTGEDEKLNTGTGYAWSHPHSSNILTDGFCETTYGSSGWSTSGAVDTGPADIASAANKVFPWGYEWYGDINEGIEQSLTSLTPGQNYVVRLIAHEAGGNDLRLTITDDTNTATILSEDFANTSVTAPGVVLITFELPTIARHGVGSDCVAITVKILTKTNNHTAYVHQIELLENLLDNPSLEGTYAGSPTVPPGWAADNASAGELLEELTHFHSGSKALEINGDAANDGIKHDSLTMTLDKFYSFGGWVKVDSGTIMLGSGDSRFRFLTNISTAIQTTTSASFTHLPIVGRGGSGTGNFWGKAKCYGGAAQGYVDDVYLFLLDDVSLTATPAAEANSLETAGIRSDGFDQCSAVVDTVTASQGSIEFTYTPRHGTGIFQTKFNTNTYIFYIYADWSNWIYTRYTDADTFQIVATVSGDSCGNDSYDPGFTVGNTYNFKITWDGISIKFYEDDVEKLSLTMSNPAFDGDPIGFVAGSHRSTFQMHDDAVFGAPA